MLNLSLESGCFLLLLHSSGIISVVAEIGSWGGCITIGDCGGDVGCLTNGCLLDDGSGCCNDVDVDVDDVLSLNGFLLLLESFLSFPSSLAKVVVVVVVVLATLFLDEDLSKWSLVPVCFSLTKGLNQNDHSFIIIADLDLDLVLELEVESLSIIPWIESNTFSRLMSSEESVRPL